MSGEITVTCDSISRRRRGKLRAVGMRHLVADVHGQMLAAFVPHGAAAARLDRRVGLAVLMEIAPPRRLGASAKRRLDRRRRSSDARRGWTAASRPPAARPARSAPSRSGTGGKLLVFDLDQLGRILGEIAVGRHDAGDRIAAKRTLSTGSVVISTGCKPSIGGAMRSVVVHSVTSRAVTTAHDTRRHSRAASTSIDTMRACACGERTK